VTEISERLEEAKKRLELRHESVKTEADRLSKKFGITFSDALLLMIHNETYILNEQTALIIRKMQEKP
jgi:hypothetical protein